MKEIRPDPSKRFYDIFQKEPKGSLIVTLVYASQCPHKIGKLARPLYRISGRQTEANGKVR